jgi:hypothetical protein
MHPQLWICKQIDESILYDIWCSKNKNKIVACHLVNYQAFFWY